jgi:outer membrane protein OmpA-like peptidoglycan-associated protein
MKLISVLASTTLLLAGCQGWLPWPAAPAPAPQPAPKVAAAIPAPSTPPPIAAPAAVAPPPAPPPAPPLPPPSSFPEAVQLAANSLFSNAPLSAGNRQAVIIDPLIDGVSGMESSATRAMDESLVDLIKTRYTALDLQPFNAASVRRSPWVLVGTFTPINAAGQAAGPKDAYRVCLALADLSTGKIVSKGFARALPSDVDITPTRFYQDSPAWRAEKLTDGYVRTCQGTKAGDPINPVYLDGILASSQIAEGTAAYQNGHYAEALEFYRAAIAMPQGKQLRALNGVYLSLLNLKQPAAAQKAFSDIVDDGLASRRLAIRFLFRPGTTGFVEDAGSSSAYSMWLDTLARRAEQSDGCLEVVGHTSKTGPEPLNERLSLLRAETVRRQLVGVTPVLSKRSIATGMGSRQTLIGLGTDDRRDALDRRVEFNVTACGATAG